MGPVTISNDHKQCRILYTFCLTSLLAIIYGVYSVIRHQTSMAKSREIGECERAAIFHLRVAGNSFAEIAKKSRLHEVKSIQKYAKA